MTLPNGCGLLRYENHILFCNSNFQFAPTQLFSHREASTTTELPPYEPAELLSRSLFAARLQLHWPTSHH